jgi:predicted NBD/HSP70 family sugar kinase
MSQNKYLNDQRIVVTLDAGGTNFVFGAMAGCKYIVDPVTMPSNAHDLDLCLSTMVKGFKQIIEKLPGKPVAISFAFPGPADYPNGIIGGFLPNFPSFRDGVALGPFLEQTFGVPTFINNDGDLYAYGEALCGALPAINARLADAGSSKRYKNLLGYTFGTGFGVGMVIDGQLNRGDNSCVETFCLPNTSIEGTYVEESISVRAIKRVYAEKSGDKNHKFEPKDICAIADGKLEGNQQAAREAFAEFGRTAGYAMATAASLVDGLIVIGGGITAARKYIMPSLLEAMRSNLAAIDGTPVARVQSRIFDLDDAEQFAQFAKGQSRKLRVYGSDKEVVYDPMKRIGVAITEIGASQAISAGAYAFALSELDK